MGFYTTVAEFPEKSNSGSCYAAVLEILEYVEHTNVPKVSFSNGVSLLHFVFLQQSPDKKKRAQNYKEYVPLVFGDDVFTV